MATPRLLGQVQAQTTPQTLYQPASGLIGVLKQIQAAHTGAGADVLYRLYLDIDGTVYNEASAMAWDLRISPGQSDLWGVWWPVTASGSLGISADTNAVLTVTAGGYEGVDGGSILEQPIGQQRPPVADTPVTLGTVPTLARLVYRSVSVCNVSTGTAAYTLYLDPTGLGLTTPAQALMAGMLINAGEADVHPFWLPADVGTLSVASSVGNALNCTAFGVVEPS